MKISRAKGCVALFQICVNIKTRKAKKLALYIDIYNNNHPKKKKVYRRESAL